MNKTPTTLIIMDGFGLSDEVKGNAVRGANTPVLDRLNGEYAHTQLSASGLDVGLPAGQMGNSEVGHTNIGGGRVVFQDLPRISRAIEDGTFFENPAYNAAMDACLEKGTALHLYGLLSNGGVHSTVEHVWSLLKMAGIKGLKRVYLHCFLDGRDVSPTSGANFVAEAQKKCAELGVGKIATVMGRYYAMDRDKRWDRLERAYDAMVYGEGIQNPDPVAAIRESYQNGVTDEFVEPGRPACPSPAVRTKTECTAPAAARRNTSPSPRRACRTMRSCRARTASPRKRWTFRTRPARSRRANPRTFSS